MCKKTSFVLMLAAVVLVGTPAAFAEGAAEEEQVTLSLATIYPPQQPASVAIDWAIEEIAEKTDGRIQIEHFHSGTLGSNPELADQLVSGAVDINVQSLSYFEGDVPEGAIDGAFFL